MVGRLVSFWNGIFSGTMLVSGSVKTSKAWIGPFVGVLMANMWRKGHPGKRETKREPERTEILINSQKLIEHFAATLLTFGFSGCLRNIAQNFCPGAQILSLNP